MSALAKLLNPTYPIIVAQHKRDDYGVGHEEHLHWALIVVTEKDELSGHCFQALDKLYSDGRGKVWGQHYAEEASLVKTIKCLGGIQIGSVKARKLDSLIKIVRAYGTVPKFEGWNCRDWILEVVGLLKAEGWIDERFTTAIETDNPQEEFLTGLRIASRATSTKQSNRFMPDIQWLKW